LKHVPSGFVRDYSRSILWAYRRAHELLREHLEEPEVHDSVGDIRRALLEGQLRKVTDQHGGDSSVERNHTGTSNYTWAKFGELYLTQSAASAPGRLNAQAEFRADLQEDPQKTLFPEEDQKVNERTRRHVSSYAVIYQGQYREAKRKPGYDPFMPHFAGVMFPNADCTGYRELIDLMPLIEHEARVTKPADVENAGDVVLAFSPKAGKKIETEEA
jgi:hypothetical protein